MAEKMKAVGVISFVRADHIGRPVFATNSTGVKVWTATYTPFGGVHTSTGALPTARFPGQWSQSESGLHQNWMRDYDPTTGRYLQADPLGLVDGASVYGYVGQNPGRWIDPNGLQCFASTGKDGNTYISCTGPQTFCPSGDCGWRDPTENNREYDQCMGSCELSYNDITGGTGGLICGAVVAVGEYCSGPFVAAVGGGICYSMHADVLCRKKCGY
ncbi:MAG: RHS repeat-associated core domain-containing protein [Rhodobacterales bacterium]|nr:RHS repeat-associated core domain-containing protein [Rhodobacterales bacterium]